MSKKFNKEIANVMFTVFIFTGFLLVAYGVDGAAGKLSSSTLNNSTVTNSTFTFPPGLKESVNSTNQMTYVIIAVLGGVISAISGLAIWLVNFSKYGKKLI